MNYKQLLLIILMQTNVTKPQTALTPIIPGSQTDFLEFIDPANSNTIYLNVFIHGTYRAETTVLDLFKTLLDEDLANSTQEKLVRGFIRQRTKSLYEASLMFDEGWWLVNADAKNANQQLYGLALKPILKTFVQQQQAIDPEAQNLNYLFGWCGLLNQSSRRKAAVALLNGLNQERQTLNKFLRQHHSTATVKVRLYCHSHGGNVALNLAWLDAIINNKVGRLIELYQYFGHGDLAHQKCEKFAKLFTKLPAQPPQEFNYPMDQWLFKSQNHSKQTLCDELVLLATPIQNETMPAMFADSFAATFNVYSDNDQVQNADLISTHGKSCVRALDAQQLKVVAQKIKPKKFQQLKLSFTPQAKINPVVKILSRGIYGPTHRDFWLISWNQKPHQMPSRPIPIIVLMPKLQELIKNLTDLEVELNFTQQQQNIAVQVPDGKSFAVNQKILDPKLWQQITATFFQHQDELNELSLVPEVDFLARQVHFLNRKALNLLVH